MSDRLQPALLDRLTDDEPTRQEPEPPAARVLSREALYRAVLRDLEQLLNATRLEAAVDLSHLPAVRRSVLNYGIGMPAGLSTAGLTPERVERTVREAILDFEPRIDEKTVAVKVLPPRDGATGCRWRIELHGQVWAQPAPMHLIVPAEFDIEERKVTLDRGEPGHATPDR